MDGEIILIIVLAVVTLLAIVYTVFAWIHAPKARHKVLTNLVWHIVALGLTLVFLCMTWLDGLDYVHKMGSISLQATLIFFAILISFVHYRDMEDIDTAAHTRA